MTATWTIPTQLLAPLCRALLRHTSDDIARPLLWTALVEPREKTFVATDRHTLIRVVVPSLEYAGEGNSLIHRTDLKELSSWRVRKGDVALCGRADVSAGVVTVPSMGRTLRLSANAEVQEWPAYRTLLATEQPGSEMYVDPVLMNDAMLSMQDLGIRPVKLMLGVTHAPALLTGKNDDYDVTVLVMPMRGPS